jgi:hypothetical protein
MRLAIKSPESTTESYVRRRIANYQICTNVERNSSPTKRSKLAPAAIAPLKKRTEQKYALLV